MSKVQKREKISISLGNTKMGKIPSVSLPPIVTCQDMVPCAQEGSCYVIKNMKYGTVVMAYSKNLDIYTKDPDEFFNQIKGYLMLNRPQYFRFHVGGDIPCQDYYDRMVKLCEEHKDTEFMFMTKSYMDGHYKKWMANPIGSPLKRDINFNIVPDNLNIIISTWPGYPIPRDLRERFPVAWLDDGRDGRIPDDGYICNKKCDECLHCWSKDRKDVVFKLH